MSMRSECMGQAAVRVAKALGFLLEAMRSHWRVLSSSRLLVT